MLRNSPIFSNILCYQKHCNRLAATCTYVLLPEVPPDTPSTNTLMEVNTEPKWSTVTPSSVYRACGKLAILYETRLEEHCDKLKGTSRSNTYEDVFKPIEEVTVPLLYAYRSVKHLSTVKKKKFGDAFEGIYKHVHRSQAERWENANLYQALKELNTNNHLTDSQREHVNMYMREAKQAGIELNAKQKAQFDSYNKELVKWQDSFRRAVYFSSRQFKETVYNPTAVMEMPDSVRNRLSLNRQTPEEGPWLFHLESSNAYKPVLEYCPERELRKKVWQNLVMLGSIKYVNTGQSNKLAIEGIRYARMNKAKLLGYSSYAQMVMEHRMAKSVENVMNFIEVLRAAFQPEAQEEVSELQKFAGSHGFNEQLQMWDIDYWSRKQKDHLYGINLSTPSEYFPLPRVLSGLFQICKALFGVTISRKEPGSVDVWHPSVEVFDVVDDRNNTGGLLYLDLFARPGEKYGGSWVEKGKDRSVLHQGKPLCYINMNLSPTLGKQPCLMSMKDVISLFSSMGHALQQLLTTVEYSELAGQNNIEWDSVHTSSYVFVMWLLRPDTLKSLSYHCENGKQLSDADVNNILSACSHMYSNKLMKNLFTSVYDLEMHFSETHPDTAVKRLWPRYMIQPLDPSYHEYCSMLNVFADSKQASGVYGILWAEMIAADVMKSFSDCTNLEQLQTTGLRFRDTFLSLGGSLPSLEIFKRFKGREPSINSFMQLHLPSQESKNS